MTRNEDESLARLDQRIERVRARHELAHLVMWHFIA